MVAVVLAALVAISAVVYGLASGGTKGIWILPDELTYGLLARSFADTGHFAIRGVHTLAYPVGYPALIAPAFLGRDPVSAYDWAKWLNAVLMSLTAVPVFFLARRILPNRLALFGAGLTLILPSMAYTRVIMSENGFFPLALVVLAVFVRALERPSGGRQLAALAVTIPAIAVRTEGLVLYPILLAGMVLVALSEAERGEGGRRRVFWREIRRFRLTGTLLPVGFVLLVAGEAVTGRSPMAVLGRYANGVRGYPVARTLKWGVYQLIDLELYVGVIPFVPALLAAVALLTRKDVPRPGRALASVTIPAVTLFVLAASAGSESNQGGPRFNYPSLPPDLHDRYCFYVTPLVLMFFLYWVRHRSRFSMKAMLPLLALASALPLVLPYTRVHSNADFDALALLPWSNSLIAGRNVHYAMAAVALVLCATLISRRRSLAILQLSVVVLSLLVMGVLAEREIADASVEVASSQTHDRSWIDQAVPDGAGVVVLWRRKTGWSAATTIAHEQALWRAEFLNTSVRRFVDLGAPMFYDLPETTARLRGGRLLIPGTVGAYRFVLAASPVPLRGRVIARDRKAGLVLYSLLAAR